MPSLAATILHPALDPPSARIRAHAWSRSVTDAVDAMERAGLELARAIPTHTRPVTTALAELHRLTVEADALRRRYNEASSAGEAGAAALKGHLQRTVRLARTRLDVLVRAVAARCGCRHARGHR